MPSKRERKLISKNRSAHHEYFIDETFECGIELSGTEVKSIRERACQITDTFALIRGGECWLVGLHIHPYSHGGVWNRDPDRRRRLLLHRKEIDFLDGKLRNRGYALVPLELYRRPRKAAAGPRPRQEALRQARGYGQARCPARDRPRPQGAQSLGVLYKLRWNTDCFACLRGYSVLISPQLRASHLAYTVLTHMSQRWCPLWAPPFLWVHTSMRFQPGLGE